MATWDFVRSHPRPLNRSRHFNPSSSPSSSPSAPPLPRSSIHPTQIQKQILLGDASTGKSSLLVRLTDSRFLQYPEATLGVEVNRLPPNEGGGGNFPDLASLAQFGSRLVSLDSGEDKGKLVKLQIWDTAGQVRPLTPSSLPLFDANPLPTPRAGILPLDNKILLPRSPRRPPHLLPNLSSLVPLPPDLALRPPYPRRRISHHPPRRYEIGCRG